MLAADLLVPQNPRDVLWMFAEGGGFKDDCAVEPCVLLLEGCGATGYPIVDWRRFCVSVKRRVEGEKEKGKDKHKRGVKSKSVRDGVVI